MTVRSRADLQAEAAVIAAEIVQGANTATRVGGAILDLADSVALSSDPTAPSGITANNSPNNGDYLRYSSAAASAYWGTNAAYNISSFAAVGTTLIQVAASLATPAFTATHTIVPTSLSLTDSEGTAARNVVGTPTSFSSLATITKNTPNASVTFTLTGSDGISSSTATRAFTWCQKVYWGTAVPGTFNAAFIQALAGSGLQTTGNKTFTVASAATEHKYYAFPTRLGAAVVVIGGFTYSWTVKSTTISVTNSNGYTENYTLIENENLGVASEAITVTVS